MADDTQSTSTEATAPAPVPATRTHVMNRSRLTATVPIVNAATGAKDIVFVHPGGKPYLPAGFAVDAFWLSQNADAIVTQTVNIPQS